MQTKFKITYLIIAILFMSGICKIGFSQEKKREIIVATKTFNQFMLKYKFGNENHLFRVSSGYFSYEDINQAGGLYDQSKIGVGLGAGMEFPKMLNEKINFYYGFEIFGRYNKTIDVNSHGYSIQGKGILGFSYFLNDILKLGFEIDPGIYYSSNKQGESTDNNFGFSLNNNFAEINLGFVF